MGLVLSLPLARCSPTQPNRIPSAWTQASFSTSDLENIAGNYDTVTCIDVMIHYPQDKMKQMVTGLASHADKRLIISFAPDTWRASLRSNLSHRLSPQRFSKRRYSSLLHPFSIAGTIARSSRSGSSFLAHQRPRAPTCTLRRWGGHPVQCFPSNAPQPRFPPPHHHHAPRPSSHPRIISLWRVVPIPCGGWCQ